MSGFQTGDEVQWANGARYGVFLRYVIINNEVWGYLVNSIFLPASLLSRYENYFTRRVSAPRDAGPLPQSGLALCKRDPLSPPPGVLRVTMKDEPFEIGAGVYVKIVDGLLKIWTPQAAIGIGPVNHEIWLDPPACVMLTRYIESLNVVVPE